jgi:hypothetical protein
LRVGAFGSPEEEDVGLWFVDFVVDPTSGLLNADASPLGLGKELSFVGDFLVDLLGEDDVAILVEVIEVLLGVLDFAGVVRHNININSIPPYLNQPTHSYAPIGNNKTITRP